MVSLLQRLFANYFGFTNVNLEWMPDIGDRFGYARKMMGRIIDDNSEKINILTVTGEWDLNKPFSDTELVLQRKVRGQNS
jgi:hypothetical protein